MPDKANPVVYVVDDNVCMRDALMLLMKANNLQVESFDNALTFLDNYKADRPGCLVLDVQMPVMSGLELQQELKKRGINLPIIFFSAYANIPLLAKAFRAGAFNFLEKPLSNGRLIASIHEAIAQDYEAFEKRRLKCEIQRRYLNLTEREKEIMGLVVKSYSNKEIAQKLKLSHRTVETHRAHLMEKMQAKHLADLIMMAIDCELM